MVGVVKWVVNLAMSIQVAKRYVTMEFFLATLDVFQAVSTMCRGEVAAEHTHAQALAVQGMLLDSVIT